MQCSVQQRQCRLGTVLAKQGGIVKGKVITGGHYDVDCRLEDPDGNVLYKEMKKQYDSFTFTASKNGTYKFCFSNEFSTFTHKTVYFDFQVGEDPPLFPSENRVSALTQMESACVSIHEALKSVIDYQTHFRLREAQGRSRAEDLNTRVAYCCGYECWSSARRSALSILYPQPSSPTFQPAVPRAQGRWNSQARAHLLFIYLCCPTT
ncbi:transmembrane emp24 domain-containing protein 7 isoform 3-T4 [Lycaon pictus]